MLGRQGKPAPPSLRRCGSRRMKLGPQDGQLPAPPGPVPAMYDAFAGYYFVVANLHTRLKRRWEQQGTPGSSATLSPTRSEVTPRPTAATIPADS